MVYFISHVLYLGLLVPFETLASWSSEYLEIGGGGIIPSDVPFSLSVDINRRSNKQCEADPYLINAQFFSFHISLDTLYRICFPVYPNLFSGNILSIVNAIQCDI